MAFDALSHLMLDFLEWAGAVLGVIGSYLLAENRSFSRYAWPIWIASNVFLIAYFVAIRSWGVLAMQAIYLLSSFRGLYRSFPALRTILSRTAPRAAQTMSRSSQPQADTDRTMVELHASERTPPFDRPS